MDQRTDIRLSLPSKGRLAQAALNFLLPGLTVLFQRPGDIVVSVRDGSVDFGITGMDVVAERQGDNGAVLVLHDALNFGKCHLCLAVPEEWETVHTMADRDFLTRHAVTSFAIINAEGTLEVAPAIGYADIIADLVSSGQTLRDNRLRPLDDGVILHSQAALIANRPALKARPEVLDVARKLLEFVEAHLRAADHVAVFANMRGASPQAIAERMFAQDALSGLQGPTR